jgi:NMD protein affecting ribosome stability and mRNA decay
LRVKPRDREASIRVALRDVQCPRCNGHGRRRIIALARHPLI